MSERPADTWKCERHDCRISYSAGAGIALGQLKCWRTDCPGRKDEPPKLKVVR